MEMKLGEVVKGDGPVHFKIKEVLLFQGESLIIPATEDYPEGRLWFDGEVIRSEGSAVGFFLPINK